MDLTIGCNATLQGVIHGPIRKSQRSAEPYNPPRGESDLPIGCNATLQGVIPGPIRKSQRSAEPSNPSRGENRIYLLDAT
jgi:hypothetical protein